MSTGTMDDDGLRQAAELLDEATALLITAGAGMGVDSGLPDFRGDEGFWRAYPPFAKLGLRFVQLADPRSAGTPSSHGGLRAPTGAVPGDPTHPGFGRLLAWGRAARHGAFVFTSCRRPVPAGGILRQRVVSATSLPAVQPTVLIVWDAEECHSRWTETMRAGPLPRCPRCGAVARPNILMFGGELAAGAHGTAEDRLQDWLNRVDGPLVVVECGAGSHVPTVRMFRRASCPRARALIRVNPREAQVPRHPGAIGLAMTAAEALDHIAARRAPVCPHRIFREAIDFWFDFSCPYAYLASARIEALRPSGCAARLEADVPGRDLPRRGHTTQSGGHPLSRQGAAHPP